jgi:hypothetical protein
MAKIKVVKAGKALGMEKEDAELLPTPAPAAPAGKTATRRSPFNPSDMGLEAIIVLLHTYAGLKNYFYMTEGSYVVEADPDGDGISNNYYSTKVNLGDKRRAIVAAVELQQAIFADQAIPGHHDSVNL